MSPKLVTVLLGVTLCVVLVAVGWFIKPRGNDDTAADRLAQESAKADTLSRQLADAVRERDDARRKVATLSPRVDDEKQLDPNGLSGGTDGELKRLRERLATVSGEREALDLRLQQIQVDANREVVEATEQHKATAARIRKAISLLDERLGKIPPPSPVNPVNPATVEIAKANKLRLEEEVELRATRLALLTPGTDEHTKAEEELSKAKSRSHGSLPEPVSPVYVSWAKYKEGTTVTHKTSFSSGTESAVAYKLVEVGQDKVVIETSGGRGSPGGLSGPSGGPGRRLEITKDYKPNATLGYNLDPKTGKPEGTTEEGTEKLKVGSTEYQCKWYKYKSKQRGPGLGAEGLEVEGQIWVCDTVPGLVVKLTTKRGDNTTVREATEVTVKK